jgi:hypothetical protein
MLCESPHEIVLVILLYVYTFLNLNRIDSIDHLELVEEILGT